jgi:hypothetical protein
LITAVLALAPSSGTAQCGEAVTPGRRSLADLLRQAARLVREAGIEVGKGSAVSSLKVASGAAPFGVADLATMLVARGKGADDVALMSIYANTGQTFYWLKSTGVNGPKDFAGRKIGNPPDDASRVMWPAFAKAVGLAEDSVSFVNIGPTAKSAALKSHAVEIISDFYNSHDIKLREFGNDLGSRPDLARIHLDGGIEQLVVESGFDRERGRGESRLLRFRAHASGEREFSHRTISLHSGQIRWSTGTSQAW